MPMLSWDPEPRVPAREVKVVITDLRTMESSHHWLAIRNGKVVASWTHRPKRSAAR
jgi:hypothetical protein